MSLHRKTLALAVISATTIHYPTAGLAADSDTALANVVISASKVEQTTAEAPSNVSVVTSRNIENSSAIRIGDVLTSQVPSLYMRAGAVGNSSKEGGTTIFSMRGAYGARSKVVVDGVTSMSDSNSGNLNLSVVSLGDVERIEVVPGVSSSLYGSDAIGGVVNIITKAPTKRELSARVVRGYGDGDRTTVEAGYRDRWANGLGLSVSLTRQNMGGYDKSDYIAVSASGGVCGVGCTPVSGWEKTTNSKGQTRYIVGDRGAIPSDMITANGTVFFDITPTSRMKAGVMHYDSKNSYSPYNIYLNTALRANLGIDGKKEAVLGEISDSMLPGESAKRETRYFAGYEGKLAGDYLLKMDASYFDRDYYYLSTTTFTDATSNYYGGPGQLTATPNVTKDLSAQLSFPVGNDHFLVTGLAFNRASLHRTTHSVTNWRDADSTKTALVDQNDGYSEMNSIYLQDQISLTRDLTLYAGARYDDWNTYGYTVNLKAGSPPPKDVAKRGEAALSPRLAAVYKLTNAVALKASIGTAFRAPTLYDLYASDSKSNPKLTRSDTNLRPERAKAFDFGTEINFPNGASFKAAYFHTRISDMIYTKESAFSDPINYPGVTTLAEKTNAAEGTTKGIELSGDLPITRWLTGSASYTWLDARITEDKTGTGILGKMLQYVPKNMASLGLQADYQGWSANLSARYTGLNFSTTDNSDVIKDAYDGNSKFWMSDLKIGYRFNKNMKASLVAYNLFDKVYYQSGLMPGRNIAFELIAKF